MFTAIFLFLSLRLNKSKILDLKGNVRLHVGDLCGNQRLGSGTRRTVFCDPKSGKNLVMVRRIYRSPVEILAFEPMYEDQLSCSRSTRGSTEFVLHLEL